MGNDSKELIDYYLDDEQEEKQQKRKRIKKIVLICVISLVSLYLLIIAGSILHYLSYRAVYHTGTDFIGTNYSLEAPVKSVRVYIKQTRWGSELRYEIIFEVNKKLEYWDLAKYQINMDIKEETPVVYSFENVYHYNRLTKQRDPLWWEWWLKYFRPVEAIYDYIEQKETGYVYKGTDSIFVYSED
jgi:hypothetical protein